MRSLARRGGALILSALLLAVGWFGGLHQSGNYHEILPGELFRSGQLSGADLNRRIAEDGIRSVINLRGSQTDKSWYDDEIAATRTAGAQHFDLRMSSAEPLDAARAAELVALIKAAPKPVLIHCEGGADRSGLAAALYLAATGHPLDEAAGQLSARYGFVGIEGVTRPWPMWESWLRLGPAAASGALTASTPGSGLIAVQQGPAEAPSGVTGG